MKQKPIKGQNLRIFIGESDNDLKCIASAMSCTLHIAAQTEDASTKDEVVGDVAWAEPEVTGASWDVNTESLVVLTDEGGKSTVDLIDLITNNTKVLLQFDITAGENNRVAQNSVLKKQGYAYMTDFSMSGQNRTNSTASASWTGVGKLFTPEGAGQPS